MDKARKDRLERAGWKVTTAGEFLGLTAVEEALIEMKLQLGDVVRKLRQRRRLSQAELAKMMGSSQPRVAKLENRDPEVTMDLQMRAILAANPVAQKDFTALIAKWKGLSTATIGPGRRRPPMAKRTVPEPDARKQRAAR